MFNGMKATVGLAFQNSYGTAPSVSSVMFLPILGETIDPVVPPLYPNDFTHVLEEAHEVEMGAESIAGDITLNAGPITLGALLKAALGDPTSAIAGSSYQHTFVPRSGDFDIYTANRPLAVFKGWAGVNSSELFYDMNLNTLELSVAQGELLKVKAGFVGGKQSYVAPQPAPTFPAGRRLPWDVASIQVGSGSGIAAHPEFRSFALQIDNGIEPMHTLAGQTEPARNARNGFRKISISGTMLFDNLLEYDAFLAHTERVFIATFVSKDTIMTNTRNTLRIDIPSLRYKELKKPTAGPGRIEVQVSGDAVYNAGSGHALRVILANTYAAY